MASGRPWPRIGVLDTGIDATHPNLDGRVEAGINLLRLGERGPHEVTEELLDVAPEDYNGHGTAVAGIIAARHNDFGIDGLDNHVKLYPIKAFDRDGTGTLADVLRGIHWALLAKLDVLNLSFGAPLRSQLLADALAGAARGGMVLVAAAGNDGTDEVLYPAGYPDVLAVGSAGEAGIAAFSNFGADVDPTPRARL